MPELLYSRSECRSCGAEVMWIPLPIGAKRPGPMRRVDPTPHRSGEYVLLASGRAFVSIYDERITPEMANDMLDMERYIDHWLTCAPRGLHNMRSSLVGVLAGISESSE